MFKNFFIVEVGSVSHGAYPLFKNEQWDGPTYIDQKNKFQLTTFDAGLVFADVLRELSLQEFLAWRLNVLIYINKDWKEADEGHLELWDLSDKKRTLLAKVAPSFNRCVIFETNEISYHGHPKPLKTPEGINRKSIATYCYTPGRPAGEAVSKHNTLYVNTEGAGGQVKRFQSGIKAFIERIGR